MEQPGTNFKKEHLILSLVILSLFAVIPALLAVENISISPDSMIYGLISQEISSGNGIKLPIIYDLHDNYTFINGAVPYLAQPPLLPALYALLGSVTPQSFLAAQMINVTAHFSITVFTFLLMRRLYNTGIALLTGVLTSVSVPLLWNAHHMLSEPLFIALTTGTVFFLIMSRRPGGSRAGNLFVAGVFASAAILTRFPGVALIPVFLWEACISIKKKRPGLVSIVLAAMLPIATSVALFIRNRMVSGTIVGWNPSAPGRSYPDAVTGTLKMLFLQFHLSEHLVTLSLIALIFVVFSIIINTGTRRRLSHYMSSGLDLVIVFVFSYTALISHAMAKVQPLFEVRYISPLVPFLFILTIILIIVVRETIRSRGFHILSLCVMIVSLALLSLGNFYKTYANSEVLLSKHTGHYRILSSPTYNWTKDNYGTDVVITTNKPFHLSFFGGYSTIKLPHRRYYDNSQIPGNMESFLPGRMSRFGSDILVLFFEAEEQYEGSYIAGLFHNRADDDNFVMIQEFPDGVIYKLKK